MAAVVPNATKKAILDGEIDFGGDTFKVMLLTSSHSSNVDVQAFIDDISSNEISGTGYTAGGASLASSSTSQDNAGNEGVWDAADSTWSSATFTARFYAVYKDTGTPGTSRIIFIEDMGSDQSPSAGDFTIQWNTEGLANLN